MSEGRFCIFSDISRDFSNMENCYINTFEIDLPPEASFFHRSDSNFFVSEYGPKIFDIPVFDCIWPSANVVIVGDTKSSQYFLWGAVTAFRSLTYFLVYRNQGRFSNITAYQPEIRKGKKPEDIIKLAGSDWRQLLVEYADIAAEKMGVGDLKVDKNVTGYCSWYYYYFNPTEKQFIESVKAIAEHKDAYPAQYMQIDDGYQASYGDWLDRNENWPTPLKDTVKMVNNLGFEAGIWTMPFLADTKSKLFTEHPDWFVKDLKGNPWYVCGWCEEPHNHWACLDFSRKEVQDYTRNLYETLYEWGFRYFKLDGGGFSAPIGLRSQSDVTGISCLRKCLEILKEAVKDSVVLGCAMPYLPSIGLVSHNRVSSDTGQTWQMRSLCEATSEGANNFELCIPGTVGLENALKGSLSNWWMYDRWFRCDPDVIIARDENTKLTLGQARMSALSGIVTGISITSDRLDRMGKDRISLLKRAADIKMEQILPVDWKDKSWPHIYKGFVDNKPALAIFNFSDYTQSWEIKDFGFNGNAVEILHPMGKIGKTIKLAPKDAALLS